MQGVRNQKDQVQCIAVDRQSSQFLNDGGKREAGQWAGSVNQRRARVPYRPALGSWGGRLLHVSTDCVFSGDRGGYRESDLAHPVDLYGRTKLAGEVTESPHLTVRTSFVGLEHENAKGLLGWFFSRKGEVYGFRKVIWSGLTTEALAEVLVSLVERGEVNGLLHIAGEPIDKFRLLCLAAEIFGKADVRVNPIDDPVCDRSLRSDLLAGLGIHVPSIRAMLEDLKDSARRHAEIV